MGFLVQSLVEENPKKVCVTGVILWNTVNRAILRKSGKNFAALIKQSAKNVCKWGILLIVVVLHARDLVARTVNQRKLK